MTAAVKVTACPAEAGFTEEVSVVVVEARFTVCVRAADVLLSQFTPVAYVAVSLWLPTLKVSTTRVATPEPLVWLDPRVVVPS